MSNFPAKLFEDLETQNLVELEETKKIFFEIVTSTKEPWVAAGLMDYYYQSGSIRVVDVLLKTNHTHIFDKLLEWLRTGTYKLPALSLLGHIIAKHPTWLYHIEKHNVFREIFKILKTEQDVISEMSALLCIVTLIAKIPYLVKHHLTDLFEVFSYLAAWNNHKSSMSGGFRNATPDQLEHLQIGLYIYFQRLYGLFPCNFMEYLRREYTSSANTTPVKGAIFTHTIVPLLETVRMHPKLITETLDSEKSDPQWRKVTAHDVITQCSRLSVDSCDNHQSQIHHHDQSCSAALPYQHHILEITQTSRFELKSLMSTLPDLSSESSSSTVTGPSTVPAIMDTWTPSQMTYFTSPLPSASAPTSVSSSNNLIHSSPANIQKPHALQMSQSFVGGALGGTSPPEAAVEATPETTPMNDVLRTQKSFPPQNSSAVRAIGLGGGGSQPSSPLKKATFRYPPEQNTVEHAFSKVIKLQQMGTNAAAAAEQTSTTTLRPTLPTSIPSSPLPIHQQSSMPLGPVGIAKMLQDKNDQHLAMQKIEPELAKFELSQSPCNVGGLHMPNSRSIQEFKEISQRERSQKVKDASSPEENGGSVQTTGHKTVLSIGDGNEGNGEATKSISAQTETWNSSAAYQHMLVELSKEGESCEMKKMGISPKEILDKIIESAIAKKNAQNAKNLEEYYKNHILLLSYQLNFERQQREMIAERNRRLFGEDKDYKYQEMANKTLQNQVHQLAGEVDNLKQQIDQTHVKFAVEKAELVAELTNWKQKFQGDQDDLKRLRVTLEQYEIRLKAEERQNREKGYELERLKGDLFDLQSEHTELVHHAEMGQHYHDQLVGLQSELLLMGELHQQWQNKLCDVEREHYREAEMDILRVAYEQELEEYRTNLLQKSSQLELAVAKCKDSDKKLINADNLLLEQKRILKITKEENEERFKALESKYETQKAIIIKMEEHLLELYKNPATCPPSELLRSEMVSSAEHASPLSVSLASSDGLSTSLRSASEVKAGPTPSSSSGNVIAASISSHTLKATNSTETTKSGSSSNVGAAGGDMDK